MVGHRDSDTFIMISNIGLKTYALYTVFRTWDFENDFR
jgi:hypothetical protein